MKRETLASWREKLGLSQQVLAEYLGISRSTVNLVERGERELPIQAFLLLNQLIRHYEAAVLAQLPPELNQVTRQKSLENLQQLIAETTWQLTKLNEELVAMEAAYERAHYQSQTFQTTRQERILAPHPPAKERELLWLSMKEDEAQQKMVTTSPEARMPLQIRRANLRATLEEAQQLTEAMMLEEGK